MGLSEDGFGDEIPDVVEYCCSSSDSGTDTDENDHWDDDIVQDHVNHPLSNRYKLLYLDADEEFSIPVPTDPSSSSQSIQVTDNEIEKEKFEDYQRSMKEIMDQMKKEFGPEHSREYFVQAVTFSVDFDVQQS